MLFFGHEFKNEALLLEALTTPSFRMDKPMAKDNQRLEFLGDAVLGLMAAERLFAEFPKEPEGRLTVRRTHLVSAAALCAAAERLGLGAKLRRNHGAEPLPPNSKILADAVEAVIGAAYLDGGFAAAQEVFATLDLSTHEDEAAWGGNPKGELQVRVQAMKPPRHPVYRLLKSEGEAHHPLFTVQVSVPDVGEATGAAHSRKDAEAAAAAKLLADMV